MGENGCLKLRPEIGERVKRLKEKWYRESLGFREALELYAILYLEEEIAIQEGDMVSASVIELMRLLVEDYARGLFEKARRNGED